ncbi:MAG: hypothetical protein FWC20_08465, partial [Oscillospiraceae bacterium]|nr:hypothetical protein [Oscillospiraceae bacterium]
MFRNSNVLKRVLALILTLVLVAGIASYALGAPHDSDDDSNTSEQIPEPPENKPEEPETPIDDDNNYDSPSAVLPQEPETDYDPSEEENLNSGDVAYNPAENLPTEYQPDPDNNATDPEISEEKIEEYETETAISKSESMLTVERLEIVAPASVVAVNSTPDLMDGVKVRVYLSNNTWEYGEVGQNVNLSYAAPDAFNTETSPAQWQIRYDAYLSDNHEWLSPDNRATFAIRLITVIDPDADMGARIVNINGIDNFFLGGNEGHQYEIEILYTPLEHQHDKGRFLRVLLPDFIGFEFSVIPPQLNVPFTISQVSPIEVIIAFDDGPIPGESLIPISFISLASRELSQTPVPESFEVTVYSYRGLDAPPDENTAEPYLHETDIRRFSPPDLPVSTLFSPTFSPASAHAIITSFSVVSGYNESSHNFTANNLRKSAPMRSTQDNTLRLLIPVPDGLEDYGITPFASGTTTLLEIDGKQYWSGPIWIPSTNPVTSVQAFQRALWGQPILNTTTSTTSLSVVPRFRGVTNEIIQNPRTFTSDRPILIEAMQGGQLERAPFNNQQGNPQFYTVTFGRIGVADFNIQSLNQFSFALPSVGSRPFRVQGTNDTFPGHSLSTVEFRPSRYTNTETHPQVIYEDMVISLGPFIREMRPHGITMSPRYGPAHFEYTLENGDTIRTETPSLAHQFDVGDSYVRSIRIMPVEINVQDQGPPIVDTWQTSTANFTWVFRLSSRYLRHYSDTDDYLPEVHRANFNITIDSEQHSLHRPTRTQAFDLRIQHETLRYDSAMLTPQNTVTREGWQGDNDNQIHFWPRIYDMISSRNNMFEQVNLQFAVNPAVNVGGIWLRSGATDETNNITVRFSDGSSENHTISRADTVSGAIMFTGLSSTRYVTRIDFHDIRIRDNNNVDGFPAWSITNPHFTLIAADYSHITDMAGNTMQPRHDARFRVAIFLDGTSVPHVPGIPTRGSESNLQLWLNTFHEPEFSINPNANHHNVFPVETRHAEPSISVATLNQVRPESARGPLLDNNGTLLEMTVVEFVLNKENTSEEFLKSLHAISRASINAASGLPGSSSITAHYRLSSGREVNTTLLTGTTLRTIAYQNPSEYITELRIRIHNVPQRAWSTNNNPLLASFNLFPLINFHMDLNRYMAANNGVDFEYIGVRDTLAQVSATMHSTTERGVVSHDITGHAGTFIIPWGSDLYVAALGLNHTISRVGENPPSTSVNQVTGGYNNPTTHTGVQTNVINNPGYWPGQTLQIDVRNILSAALDREGHDTRDAADVRTDSLPRGFAIRSLNASGATFRNWVGTATGNDLTNVVVYIPVEPGFSLVEGTMQLMRGNAAREGAVRSVSTIPSPEGTWLRVDLASYRPAGLRTPGTVEFSGGDVRNILNNTPGSNSLGGTANFTGGDTLRFELRSSDFIPWDSTSSRPVIRGQYYIDVTNTGYTGEAELRFYEAGGLKDNEGNRFISGNLQDQNTPPASMIRRNIGPVGSGSQVLENTNPVTIRYSGTTMPTNVAHLQFTPYHFPNTSHRLGDLRVRINAPTQQVGIFGLSTVGGDPFTQTPNNNTVYYNHESVGITVRASHVASIGNPTADYMIYVEIPRTGWGNLNHPGLAVSGPATILETPPNDSTVFEYTVSTDLTNARSLTPDESLWLSEDDLLSSYSWSDVTMVRISVRGVGNLPFLYDIPMQNREDKKFIGNQEIQASIHFRSPQLENNALRSVQVLPTFTLIDYTITGHLWHDQEVSGQMSENDIKLSGSVRVLHPTGFISAWSPATPESGFNIKIPAYNPADGLLGYYRLEVAAPGYEPVYAAIDGAYDSRFADNGDGTGYRDLRIGETNTVINAGFKESQKVSIVYLNADGIPHAFDNADIGETISAPEDLPTPPGRYYDFLGWQQSNPGGTSISTHLWRETFELTETYLAGPITPGDTIYFVAVWIFNPPLAFAAPDFLDFGAISPQFGTNFIELPTTEARDDRPAQIPDTNVNFVVTAGEHFPGWRIDVRHDTPITLRHRDHSDETPKFLDPDALVFLAGSTPIFGAAQRVYTYNGGSDEIGWQDGLYTINWMSLQNRLRIRTTTPLIEVDTSETIKTP